MSKNKIKQEKAITLIALVVSIIVLLILAGVSIAVLTGENGIINRTTGAKKTTEEAEVMEKIRLAFLNAQIGKYAGKNEDFAAVMQAELVKTLGPGATVETNGDDFKVTYNGMIFDVTKTGVVNKVEGISIASTLTLKIIDGTKTPQNLTATLNGISGTVTWSKTAGTGDISLSSTTGDTISVTPESEGTATITASCSGKSATCDVTVEAVNSVAVTFNLDGGNVSGNTANIVENELPGNPITLPVPTKTNYEFNGWDTTQSAANPSIAKTATTIEAPNSNTTYYAQWKQPSQAFRSYGTYVTASTQNGGMGEIGTRVFLVSGSTEQNPKTISVGDGTIQDNWKVFYEDSDFVYLIYGDYYPVNELNIQTNSDISTITFGGDKLYAVSDSTNRENLLKYLRNNSAYEWNSSTMTENHGTGGSTYASWNNLRTALSSTSALSGKTISIQGSPDIDLWDRSWTASGNTAVLDRTSNSTLKNGNGYLIRGSKPSSNVSGEAGYSNTLYFPYTGNTSSDGLHAADANGYRLASPGAGDNNRLCIVSYGGYVNGNDYYGFTNICVRPVVSIAK